jgi:uncharacterized protein YuzE
MQLSYDPRFNIAYIRFRPKTSEVESIKISDELIIDITPEGTIYGIELLNANEQLQWEKGKILVINKSTELFA